VITFRALTTNVSVALADDVPDAAIARALLHNFPRADGAELSYELTATSLRRDGVLLELHDPRDLVPLFEMDLYEQAGTRAAPGWLLHAAAFDVGGRALVLCGASGAGKTTLTLALAARGLRLLTEEVVWIDKSANVRGLPRAIHVPAQSAQRARIPAGWTTLPYPIRDRAGVVRDNVLVVPPREALVLDALPLRAIVRIGHGPDWPTHLRESPHHVALQRLWDRSLRQDDSGLEAATTVLREHGSFELSSTKETDALALLEPLLK
jgi:adenylate kinase family enzyme